MSGQQHAQGNGKRLDPLAHRYAGVRSDRLSSGQTQHDERPDRKSGLEPSTREGCLPVPRKGDEIINERVAVHGATSTH